MSLEAEALLVHTISVQNMVCAGLMTKLNPSPYLDNNFCKSRSTDVTFCNRAWCSSMTQALWSVFLLYYTLATGICCTN